MRVLQILRVVDGEGGGIQTYMASVGAALAGTPVQLQVGGLWPGKPPPYPCELRHMGRERSSRMSLRRQFWQWLRRDVPQAEVVHIHNVFGAPLLWGALLSRWHGVPYVISPHGRLVAEAQDLLDWRHRLYLRVVALPLLRGAAAVIVTTEKDRQDLLRIDSRLKIEVVSPALPVDPAATAPVPAADFRIAFVGRLVPLKNLPTLLRALALMRRRGVAATVDVVGWFEENHEPEIQSLVDELGIRQAVRFHGKLRGEPKDSILRAARVLAMPSTRENFSFVTAEALALGVPVAVSSSVGLSPTVARHECGIVIAPFDVEAWADGLQRFADAAGQSLLAARALTCARQEFSLSAMRASLLQVYGRAIKSTT